jgi:hypothetical protein
MDNFCVWTFSLSFEQIWQKSQPLLFSGRGWNEHKSVYK